MSELEHKVAMSDAEIDAVFGGTGNPPPQCTGDENKKTCSCPEGYRVTYDFDTGRITCEPVN